jgi:hypothetical protein
MEIGKTPSVRPVSSEKNKKISENALFGGVRLIGGTNKAY